MKRDTNPVPLTEDRARLLAFRKRHGNGLHKANTLADVIWPEQPFSTTQGAGAAASRVLKRLGCKWQSTEHQWGWAIDNCNCTMKRLYLSQDGTVRTPSSGEHGHLDMGRTILGPDWRGDVEETYAAMWNAGWVRVVNSPDTLVGEQWHDGKAVAFADLPPVQREWLTAHSVQAGKRFVWNAKEVALTPENQSEVPPVQP